ncbi:ribosomal protein S5 domain 2-type protein [Mucidula mucida]|nr:ribosomal protein S5 domain 2-type protein [Mucidula mucida]
MSTSEDADLKAAVFQRLHPRVYLERFVAENVRPDGRQIDAWREISVNVGSISSANGSSLVRVGNTTVVCGVKAELAEPELDAPTRGFLVPNLDLPAICSPKFKPGPPTEEAQVLSDRLNEILIKTIPPESLCIHPGKSVWVLYVDATCINYDGNAFDTALIAMVAALKNTILPKATYNEDTLRTTCSRKTLSPLQLSSLPISMSFGIFDSHVFPDPTSFEEPLLDTSISVVIDDKGKICSVSQIGSDVDALLTCTAAARKRHEFLSQRIYL